MAAKSSKGAKGSRGGLQPFYQGRQVHETNPHAFALAGEGSVDVVSEDDFIGLRMTAVKGMEGEAPEAPMV